MQLSAPLYRLKRRAKQAARDEDVPLHLALDRIAVEEGFQNWGHLSDAHSNRRPARDVFLQLATADMLLLAARPGHGKTLLGLELVDLAISKGRTGLVFSLECTEAEIAERLDALRTDSDGGWKPPAIITSDDICADVIIARAEPYRAAAFVLVDYLQLLDQRRSNPPLADQLNALRAYAKRSGAIIAILSQIDRRFMASEKDMPSLSDLRMPNAFDPAMFDRVCFVHDGVVRMEAAV